MLDNRQAKAPISYKMSARTALGVLLYSHALVLVSRPVGTKKLNFVQISVKSKLALLVVQLVQNAWDRPTKSFCLGHFGV